ncbi:hypothetical protein SEPCBS57363_004506 [Sporothrix epigloea]|uniref:Uncharacterized protein n=1 Tax=Sporothrix epigloea TaxID=1892477 RepID=A0ABP0DWB3_9PEZI
MAAAAVLALYSHDHFQSLPTLEEAKQTFLSDAKGEALVKAFFKEIFVEEGMERTFGLAMLHRHFDLGADEKLVEYQGTSTPWKAVAPEMKEPQSSIWAFDGETLKPTEFFYSEKEDTPLSEEALAFQKGQQLGGNPVIPPFVALAFEG